MAVFSLAKTIALYFDYSRKGICMVVSGEGQKWVQGKTHETQFLFSLCKALHAGQEHPPECF